MKRILGAAILWPIAVALLAIAMWLASARHLQRPVGRGLDPASPPPNGLPMPVAVPNRPTAPLAGGTERPCPIQLRDVTGETGVTFQHTDGSSGRRYIVEAMSTGIATFDYDGDGWIDIYFPNGAPLPGSTVDKPSRHALYRNLGNWTFQDVTERAGVACTAYGMGVTVGDYDNDGHPDVYVSNFGPNVLYRNEGNGTFVDKTRRAGVARSGRVEGEAGVAQGETVGAGACFLDADGDGNLDLYVGNYMRLDCSTHVPRTLLGIPSYPNPPEYSPIPDSLYRNNGDGTFSDVSGPSGIAARAGRSMGMICADYDNDGDVDVFVCNDVQENFLFRNDGRATFDEVGLIAGVAANCRGEILANMAPDCGDFNNDGLLDFYTTNYWGQWPMLLRNCGDGLFADVTTATNAGAGLQPLVNFGCAFADFDNDGHLDLFIVNGHTEDNIEMRNPSVCYRCRNTLLRNTGEGKFVDATARAGDGLLPAHAGRGVALDDLDNDGDVDAVILNSRERPTILRNMLRESGSTNHWLQIRLQGVKSNRDAVGAHVTVVAGGLRRLDEVHSGRSYQSNWGARLHFGLGGHERVDRIEVRWIGGAAEVYENVRADRLITITEGRTRFGKRIGPDEKPGGCEDGSMLAE